MNLACLWCERKLAYRAIEGRTVPESGWIRQHVESCTRCAEFLRTFAGLNRRLSEMTESCSDGIVQKSAILERIADLPTPRRSYAAPAVAYAACLVLLIAIVSRPDQAPQLPTNAVPPTKRASIEARVIVASVPKKTVKPSRITQVRKAPKPHSTPTKRKTRIRLRRMVLAAQATKSLDETQESTQTAKPVGPKTAAVTTARWEQIGAWYEARGDHGSALAAYTRAFEDRPTPELAFTAGRAAECAGDISSAVEFYARALQPEGQSESEPKKGSATCIDARSSV